MTRPSRKTIHNLSSRSLIQIGNLKRLLLDLPMIATIGLLEAMVLAGARHRRRTPWTVNFEVYDLLRIATKRGNRSENFPEKTAWCGQLCLGHGSWTVIRTAIIHRVFEEVRTDKSACSDIQTMRNNPVIGRSIQQQRLRPTAKNHCLTCPVNPANPEKTTATSLCKPPW